jgi:hypothetical protein
VSLFIAPDVGQTRASATAPSGDVGLGDVRAEFELGPALRETIRTSAEVAFARVAVVETKTCAAETREMLDASLVSPPYVQIHWRNETPRVGGGTVAEFIVRVARRDCSDREIARAVAYGFGSREHMQTGANWPSEDDFRPGIDGALEDLRSNLLQLFRDMGETIAER